MDRESRNYGTREARERYAEAFDRTMIKIWREKLLLDRKTRAYRSGSLWNSVAHRFRFKSNESATAFEFGFKYSEYGIYVERGTGRGYYYGNGGDIGPYIKVRDKRPWMHPKYFMSVCNIRDFMCESLGLQAVNVVKEIALDHERQILIP